MDSWLKAAEGLFEVVDRRAKAVASDLSEEQGDSKSPASNGQGSQGKRTKSKPKAQKALSDSPTIISDTTQEKSGSPSAPADIATSIDKVDPEIDGSASTSTNQPKEPQPSDATSPLLGSSLSKILGDDVGKHDTDDAEALVNDADIGVATIAGNGDPVQESASDICEMDPPPAPKGVEGSSDEPTSTGQIIKSRDLDASKNVDIEKSDSVASDTAPNNDTILKDSDLHVKLSMWLKNSRVADERTAKATELEQKVALLEVECASLNQELQDMEARVRREQKKAPEEANQVIQAEMQKMRVEMAAMKRDAEHYSRQEHMELEKRYRELTDLLYYKQTQLETMVSEKAATEFQLEKEIKRLQEAKAEAERSRVSRRASSSWEDETEIKSLEHKLTHWLLEKLQNLWDFLTRIYRDLSKIFHLGHVSGVNNIFLTTYIFKCTFPMPLLRVA
ncbi:hypothetical protein JHK85_045283 [Glycine max]|nr:hypothetical protein JHK85_045283 [Glycine max]